MRVGGDLGKGGGEARALLLEPELRPEQPVRRREGVSHLALKG